MTFGKGMQYDVGNDDEDGGNDNDVDGDDDDDISTITERRKDGWEDE